LRFGNVNKDFGNMMPDVEKFHDGGTIIEDNGSFFVIMNELVHSLVHSSWS
jgi:hypothetical protein